MSYVVVARNPRTKTLHFVENGDETNPKPVEFETSADAAEVASAMPLFLAWGYEILEIII